MFVKYFVPFLGNGFSRRNAFQIYWPLIVLIYQMWETSRNKLNKHSVTKNCSDLFTVWINCSSDLKFFANFRPSASNFKSFSQSLGQFFLTVGQSNFATKYQLSENPTNLYFLGFYRKRMNVKKKGKSWPRSWIKRKLKSPSWMHNSKVWQYRLWSFQERDTNLESFLATDQL